MGVYGTRDGTFKPRLIQLGQKRLKTDVYKDVVSSAGLLLRMDAKSTTVAYLGTALDTPRTISVTTVSQADAERAMNLIIKGYTAQGAYTEETLTLATANSEKTRGNIAFGVITSVVGAVGTKGYGTYGTVDIYPTDTLGISEYCENEADVLQVDNYTASAAFTSTSGTIFVSTTNFSRTYQTLDIAGLKPAGSTVAIKYLSKFQRRA